MTQSLAQPIAPPAVETVACHIPCESLLALVVQRHESALGLLYDRYGRLVYTVALRITGDRQTAEEVVQDVFQNVWQSAAGFQGNIGAFSPWLLAITRHRAIDATRSRREHTRRCEQVLSMDVPATNNQYIPEHEGSRQMACSNVHAALARLPVKQQQVIELAYYTELTCVGIAQFLGEPVGTIKTCLRLGLIKLRDALHDK